MADYIDERPSKRRRHNSFASDASDSDRRRQSSHKSSKQKRHNEHRSDRRSREDLENRHHTSRSHRDSTENRARSRRDERNSDLKGDERRSKKYRAVQEQDDDGKRSSRKLKDSDQDGRRRHRRDRSRDARQSTSTRPFERSKAPLPSQNDAFTATELKEDSTDDISEIQKPNFGVTGKLAAASNTVQTANQTIVLKYHEPPEARKPPAKDQWRLYVFKGSEILDTIELWEQSCWLIGREIAVADLPLEHPSCSKQHAVIQFRYLEKRNEFGDKLGKVRPYILDLESANGTSLNESNVPAAKYVELRDKDMIQFGSSSREYIIQLPPAAKKA